MMELFELRTLVDNTPSAPWEEVIEADVLFFIRFCYALCLSYIAIAGVMVVLGWCQRLVEVLR